ncbi:DNA-directed RNA polymerase subunit P [Candidatus Pacearchaeota archaeon ex4484_26]|nr:MAG: DNA-directed RNA polymerase subunit P [Candidatus Pacearchaeota archaeon ex4484_26]
MAIYKCFKCGKKISHKVLKKSKGKCPYCDSRIFYKTRNVIKKIKAI